MTFTFHSVNTHKTNLNASDEKACTDATTLDASVVKACLL